MKRHLVYLADIHGKDVKIEKDVLRDIAVLRRDERTAGVGDVHRIIRNGRDADAIGVRHTRITREIIDRLDRCRIIALNIPLTKEGILPSGCLAGKIRAYEKGRIYH